MTTHKQATPTQPIASHANTRWMPFHAVFLDRVIRIAAVQCERAAVADEDAAGFFESGRLIGELDDYRWSLDQPELYARRGEILIASTRDVGITASWEKSPSPPLQRAWDAAIPPWLLLMANLRDGKLMARARHPTTGEWHDLASADWIATGLILDVRAGELLAKARGRNKADVLWTAIMLREASEPCAAAPEPARQEPQSVRAPKRARVKGQRRRSEALQRLRDDYARQVLATYGITEENHTRLDELIGKIVSRESYALPGNGKSEEWKKTGMRRAIGRVREEWEEKAKAKRNPSSD